ncbi:hypothetical protein GCM10023238_31170 [Streptomyces heliomycini]
MRTGCWPVDLHTDQIQGFFDGPVDHLFALPLLADLRGCEGGPFEVDGGVSGRGSCAGGGPLVRRLGAPLAIVHKRRDKDVANQVTVHEVVGDVRGVSASWWTT